jgi:hypothetical protein
MKLSKKEQREWSYIHQTGWASKKEKERFLRGLGIALGLCSLTLLISYFLFLNLI